MSSGASQAFDTPERFEAYYTRTAARLRPRLEERLHSLRGEVERLERLRRAAEEADDDELREELRAHFEAASRKQAGIEALLGELGESAPDSARAPAASPANPPAAAPPGAGSAPWSAPAPAAGPEPPPPPTDAAAAALMTPIERILASFAQPAPPPPAPTPSAAAPPEASAADAITGGWLGLAAAGPAPDIAPAAAATRAMNPWTPAPPAAAAPAPPAPESHPPPAAGGGLPWDLTFQITDPGASTLPDDDAGGQPQTVSLELEISAGRRTFERTVDTDSVLVGRRSPDARLRPDIDLWPDQAVSRRHLQISAREGRYFLRDLGSTNGTEVNEQPVDPEAEVELRSGDEILLGEHSRIRVRRAE